MGGAAQHAFTLSNPTADALPLRLRVLPEGRASASNFALAAEGGGPLVMPPYADVPVVLTYTPSALVEEQAATIALSHPSFGVWLYHARGVGTEPAEMATTEVTAVLGQPTSSTLAFSNPFTSTLSLSVTLELGADDGADDSPFRLLRRGSALVVAPSAAVQIPFSFVAHSMAEMHAVVCVGATHQGRPLAWRFPLRGVAVSRPLSRPLQLVCRARQPLRRELELPTPGLSPGVAEEGFAFELDVQASAPCSPRPARPRVPASAQPGSTPPPLSRSRSTASCSRARCASSRCSEHSAGRRCAWRFRGRRCGPSAARQRSSCRKRRAVAGGTT